jgi:16S rRNA (cytosine1402-N4)-methyltransferase
MALNYARNRLAPFGDRVQLAHAHFSALAVALQDWQLTEVDGLLADLGVSSPQLDTPQRGFSFRDDGPLDMRMDVSRGAPLAALLPELSEEVLANAIFEFGEDRHSRRVAKAIKAAQPTTTQELAHVVRSAVPRSRDGLDPATRTFQGLRILINQELAELDALLTTVPHALAPNAMAVVISFHSLEDRRVKTAFGQLARICVCPPQLPVCICQRKSNFQLMTKKAMAPGLRECRGNPRARSAKLRAIRKVAEPQ